MNNLDKDYISLVNNILDNGHNKSDRTGTGTKSVFGRQIRHKMSDGFPLLTTKQMPWKVIVTELIWFLRGDTNIKFLIDNGCNIWNGDAYKNYKNNYKDESVVEPDWMRPDIDFQYLTEENFINKIKTDDEFAKKWGELGPIYGKQWRSWRSQDGMISEKDENGMRIINWEQIDQIQNAINLLKTDPDSRRNIVSAWNVGELDKMVLPPCHNFFQFYTRELSLDERLDLMRKRTRDGTVDYDNRHHGFLDFHNIPKREISLMWNQRSVDTGLGLPFNIASYALLLQLIGEIVNMVPEELIGNLGDTHLYNNHIEPIKEQLDREGFKLPNVYINSEFWPTESGECGVGSLNENFDFLIKNIQISDFQLMDYKSHEKINLPLSN